VTTAREIQQPQWPALVCPEHREPLTEGAHGLSCPRGHNFEVVRGIPRFVPAASYADGFGAQWNQYRLTQLDSHTGTTITANRARRCLGDALWDGLAGLHVLEVGCGAGRFTEVLLQRGARVTSVDLSSAVEANLDNFPIDENHRVVQANAAALPFKPGQFDVVFCLGVIQHTPSPEETVASLFSNVRSGGHLVIDHYQQNLSNATKVGEPIFRVVVKRLSAEQGIRATEALVRGLLPVHRAVRGFFPAQALLSRFSPVRVYYHAYPELADDHQLEWAKLDTHDALTSWYRHLRSPKQMRNMIESMGGEVLRTGGHLFCEVLARRPG